MSTVSPPVTQAHRLTRHLPVNNIEVGIAHHQDGKLAKLGDFHKPSAAMTGRSPSYRNIGHRWDGIPPNSENHSN